MNSNQRRSTHLNRGSIDVSNNEGPSVEGFLWWSKDADLDAWPEMRPATGKQLSKIIIERDKDGKIIGVRNA